MCHHDVHTPGHHHESERHVVMTDTVHHPESRGSAPRPIETSSLPRSAERARRDARRGMAAGALAAVAMLVVIIVLRSLTGIVSLIDSLADALLLVMPMGIFSFMLEIFGSQAKTLLLVGLIALLVLGGALVGRAYARRTAGARRPMWARAISTGLVIFGLSAAFMLFFVGNQTPDAISGQALLQVMSVLGAASAAFVVVLGGVLALLRLQEAAPGAAARFGDGGLSRRRLLTRGGTLAAAVGAVLVLGREVRRVAGRKTVGIGESGTISPAITPNEDFYTISKNFVDPDPDRGDDWSVRIDGVVERSLMMTRADLEAMAGPEFVSTLTCISNPIGGPLIGTAAWVGAPLAKVLERAGVGPGVVKVILEGEDGYTDSIPIEQAMAPEPAIVWTMNGEPLPRSHGTPVRLIVPGLYGIKNVKWLTKITVSNEDYEGYWQQREWTDTAIIKTSSRIDVPGDRGVVAAGTNEIGGVAFAGDRGIQAVEVSTDGGDTWTEAPIIENPSPAGLSWVIWRTEWLAKTGTYDLVVRATDGTGEVQTDESAPELPDGASGWHRITVGVA